MLLRCGLPLAALALTPTVLASDALPPPSHPWPGNKPWGSFDHASIRRGFKVYKEICSTCHGLNLISYRNFVDVFMTEDEAKALAAEATFEDLVDDDGDLKEREGKLTDHLPSPYPNEKAARSANNGALPPDLSLIVKARPDGANYVFSLLTGYRDAPAGVHLREGMYYNPYFAGGAIGMTPPLTMHGQLSFEDGTDASISQMAKDVTEFLAWCAEPERDDRKKMGLKAVIVTALALIPMWYYKKFRFNVLKNKKIFYEKLYK